MLKYLWDRLEGKAPPGAKRSGKWRKIRKEYLKKHPTCAACGGNKKIEIHHKIPFHLAPDLELDPNNLITLCESGKYGVVCHQAWGHTGRYTEFNPAVERDAMMWLMKLGKNKNS